MTCYQVRLEKPGLYKTVSITAANSFDAEFAASEQNAGWMAVGSFIRPSDRYVGAA